MRVRLVFLFDLDDLELVRQVLFVIHSNNSVSESLEDQKQQMVANNKQMANLDLGTERRRQEPRVVLAEAHAYGAFLLLEGCELASRLLNLQ